MGHSMSRGPISATTFGSFHAKWTNIGNDIWVIPYQVDQYRQLHLGHPCQVDQYRQLHLGHSMSSGQISATTFGSFHAKWTNIGTTFGSFHIKWTNIGNNIWVIPCQVDQYRQLHLGHSMPSGPISATTFGVIPCHVDQYRQPHLGSFHVKWTNIGNRPHLAISDNAMLALLLLWPLL